MGDGVGVAGDRDRVGYPDAQNVQQVPAAGDGMVRSLIGVASGGHDDADAGHAPEPVQQGSDGQRVDGLVEGVEQKGSAGPSVTRQVVERPVDRSVARVGRQSQIGGDADRDVPSGQSAEVDNDGEHVVRQAP